MARDPIREAFVSKLQAVLTGASIPWPIKDTWNTDNDDPTVSDSYLEFDWLGDTEDQYSFGAPGNNWFRGEGQANINVVVPLSRNRDLAETYAKQIRDGFRGARIPTADNRNIRIDTTGGLSGGETIGGMWAETIALGYSIITTG